MEFFFLILLFAVAFLYSSVGHGGASGYLALMALFGIAPAFMRSTSLTLNVFVSAIALFAFTRAGYFRLKLALPFVASSVPFAFIGASMHIAPGLYETILGVLLLFAVARMLFVPGAIAEKSATPPIALSLIIGAVLGFFSGMTGIGGGIILSPILILFHWATVKESAAISAVFIFLNSISGLTALFFDGLQYDSRMLLWIMAGIAGGIAGSHIGSSILNPSKLKYLLSSILLLASIKLLLLN